MEPSAKQLLCPPNDGEDGSQVRKSDSFVKSLSRHSSFSSIVGEVSPLGRSITSFVYTMKRPYDPVQVEYLANEGRFKERLQTYFIENQKSSYRIRLFNVLIKLLSCILYCVRVVYDQGTLPELIAKTTTYSSDSKRLKIEYLIWVDRGFYLWLCQTVVGIISLVYTILIFYISYRGNILSLLLSVQFLLELFTSIPFIVTIFVPPWREMFIPVFLNCWLAKFAFEAMLNDKNRATQKQQSALSQQMYILFATLLCLLFTSTCGIEHLQRAGYRQLSLDTALYFVVVTFATVGYGDIYPDYWMSQMFVIVMICVAIGTLPTQIEKLGHTYAEKQKTGGEYSKRRAKYEKHVVVTVTQLRAEVIIDFLNEFYAHSKLQNYYVILLSPGELDNAMRLLLQVPLWSERVIYIRGSALKDTDLERARLAEAESCFILSARTNPNKIAADEHTILRSWAVRDFAPHCPQYVQIFRPEAKMHVKHAEFVICEDEFKFSLLANNYICPGISTFITLLVHTSRGEEGQKSSESWHRLYGHHSGNEIYHILLGRSKYFGEYEGKSFTFASFHAHHKYGVCLVGVQRSSLGATLQLNPGQQHVMQKSDVCYYMGLTEEPLSMINTSDQEQPNPKVANTVASIGTLALDMQHSRPQSTNQSLSHYSKVKGQLKKKHKKKVNQTTEDENVALALELTPLMRKRSIEPVPDSLETAAQQDRPESERDNAAGTCDICGTNNICIGKIWTKDLPRVTPYIGTSATLCHMQPVKRPICCIQLLQPCIHCNAKTANDYKWANPAIVVAADHASSALYNFIIPLRAHYRPIHELNPVVLLLEQIPDDAFLDAISSFPLVYWMRGTISNLDNLLRSGICQADHLVLVKEGFASDEEHLADCNSIVSVQTIHRMFPSLHIISELTHSSNMRFVQFNAKDAYALQQSRFEKQEKESGSHMSYMFRLPFASGRVFSANMLDTLLYQAFVKDYLVQFVRLLLGIDQDMGSGYLTSFELTEEDMWIKTYGRLFQKLSSSEADIPIGIFRTQQMEANTVSVDMEELQQPKSLEGENDEEVLLRRHFSSKYRITEPDEITNNIKNRMEMLGLPTADYSYTNETRGKVSFVLINPSFDLQLEPGDVIKPFATLDVSDEMRMVEVFAAYFSYIIKPPVPYDRSIDAKMHPRRGLRRPRDHSHRPPNLSNLQSAFQRTDNMQEFGTAPIAKTDSAASVVDDIPTLLINSGRDEAK